MNPSMCAKRNEPPDAVDHGVDRGVPQPGVVQVPDVQLDVRPLDVGQRVEVVSLNAPRVSLASCASRPHPEYVPDELGERVARTSVDEIDDARRRGELSWDDYARLLRNHPDGARLLREFRPLGGRDRQGRLRGLDKAP